MADTTLTNELAARGVKPLTPANIDAALGVSVASLIARIQTLEAAFRTVFFTSAAYSVNEGNSGTVTLNGTMKRTGDLSLPLAVTTRFIAGTLNAADFPNGLPGDLVWNFAAGSDTASNGDQIKGDTDVEANETLTRVIVPPPGYSFGATPSYTGTVLNDDVPSSDLPYATMQMAQLKDPDRIYQRDTDTGGTAGRGTGPISVVLNITVAGAIYARLRDAEDGTTIIQDKFLAATGVTVGNGPIKLTGIRAGLQPFYLDILNSDGTYLLGTVRVFMGGMTMMGPAQSLGVRFISNAFGSFASVGVTPSKYIRALAYTIGDGSETSPPTWGEFGDGKPYTGAGAAAYLNTLVERTGVAQGIAGTPINGSPTGAFSVGGSQEARLKTLLDMIGGFETYFTFIGHTDSTQTRPWGEFRCNMSGAMDICASRNSRGRRFTTVSMSIPTGNDPNNNWGSEAQKNRIRGFTYDWVIRDAAADCARAVYARPAGVVTDDSVHPTNAGGVTIAKAGTDALLNGSDTFDAQFVSLATEGAAIVRSGPDPLVYDTGNDYPQALLQSYFGVNKLGNGGTGVVNAVMQCYFSSFQAGGVLFRSDAAYWYPQSDGSIKSHTNVASAAGVLPLNKWCTVAFTTISEDLFGGGAARTEVWVDGVLVVTMAHTSMTPGFNIASADFRSFNGGTGSNVISSGLKLGKVAIFNKHTQGKMPAGQLTGKEGRMLAAYPLNGSLTQIAA